MISHYKTTIPGIAIMIGASIAYWWFKSIDWTQYGLAMTAGWGFIASKDYDKK